MGMYVLDASAALKGIVFLCQTPNVPPTAGVTPTSRDWGQTAEGGVTLSMTETRCPSGTRCIHPSSASVTPTLSPDALQETRGTFRYFPVLAGLQLLALLAMSAAALWVSLQDRRASAGTPRPRPAPLSPGLPRSRRRGQGRQHRGPSGRFLPPQPRLQQTLPVPALYPRLVSPPAPTVRQPRGYPRSAPIGRALPRGRPQERAGLRREEPGAAAR